MTEQITLDEALKLVLFIRNDRGDWGVGAVNGDVRYSVRGNVYGSIVGSVLGDVEGRVGGDVQGRVGGCVCGPVGDSVCGTIGGREWEFIETPKEKLQRLIDEGADKKELIEAVNQLEDDE